MTNGVDRRHYLEITKTRKGINDEPRMYFQFVKHFRNIISRIKKNLKIDVLVSRTVMKIQNTDDPICPVKLFKEQRPTVDTASIFYLQVKRY